MLTLDDIATFFGVSSPSALEIIFLTCALLGVGFFTIMMVLMLLGDIFGGVVDSAFDTDITMDTDLAFDLFSIQGVSAAVGMFGLVGMFTLKSDGSDVMAVFAGGLGATASLFAVQQMMKGIMSLQVDGTLDLNDGVGEVGTMYVRIQPGQTGEVQVPISGGMRTLPARAKDRTLAIATGELVKVVEVIGSMLFVEPLEDEESE